MHDVHTKTERDVETLRAVVREQKLDLRSEEEWRELIEHIDVHRYLINQRIPWTITWDDAVFSWYENVLIPVVRAASHWEVRNAFPQKSRGQLYFAIATHWYYLLERDATVSPEYAAVDFAAQYGSGLASWFSRFVHPAH